MQKRYGMWFWIAVFGLVGIGFSLAISKQDAAKFGRDASVWQFFDDSGISVRVLIEENTKSVAIEGRWLRGRLVEKNWKLTSKGQGAHLQETGTVSLPLVFFPKQEEQVVKINGKSYRGNVVVLPGRKGGFDVVNQNSLESYLCGLREVPASWNLEALKAWGIAARTYTLWSMTKSRQRAWDVYDSERSQVYVGTKGEHKKISRAISATRGVYLADSSMRPVAAFYSRSNGGIFSLFKGSDINAQHYRLGIDIFSKGKAAVPWEEQVDKAELGRRLRSAGVRGIVLSARVVKRSDLTQRVEQVRIAYKGGQKVVSGSTFKRAVKGKSTLYVIHDDGNQIRVEGRGHGHGVGLAQESCQIAASEHGLDHLAIIRFFYPGATLMRFQNSSLELALYTH